MKANPAPTTTRRVATGARRTRKSAWILAFWLLTSAGGGFSQAPDADQVRRGIDLAVEQEYASALEIFKGELLKQPRDPLLNYYVGITLVKLKRWDAAVVYLEKAVGEKAPFPQAFFWLAQAYLDQDRGRDAEKVVKKGLDRFPDNRDLAALKDDLESGADKPG